MKKLALPTLASCALLTTLLAGCQTQDTTLIQNVPVGSGTSTLVVVPFVDCIKAKWGAHGGKLRQYSQDAEGEIVDVRGPDGRTVVMLVAEPSAHGTGYTIYGDIAAASYVTEAHTCD